MLPFTTFNENQPMITDCVRANLTKIAKARGISHLVSPDVLEELEHQVYDLMLKSGTVERYDPNHVPATTLSSYIFGQARFLSMNVLSKFIEQYNQETVSIDEEIAAKRTRIQLIAMESPAEDPYVTKALQYCLAQLQKDYPPTDSRDFAWLFQSLAQAAQDGDAPNLAKLAEQKGITRQALSLQVKALRKLEPVQKFFLTLKGELAPELQVAV